MSNWKTWLLVIALATTALLAISLRQVRLKHAADVATLKRGLTVQAGRTIYSMEGSRRNQPLSIKWPDKNAALVLYFSPSCHYCEENWPNWDGLLREARLRKLRVVLTSRGGPPEEEFVRTHDIHEDETLFQLSESTIDSMRLDAAPSTILMSPQGVVLKAEVGVLSAEEVKTFKRHIHAY